MDHYLEQFDSTKFAHMNQWVEVVALNEHMNSFTCLIKPVFWTSSLTNQTNLSSQHYYFVTA